MIEIQCTSCHTRYRVDERVLPEDTPTFKCSRCGHVFSADPVRLKNPKPLDQTKAPKPDPGRSAKAPGAQSRPIFGRREEPAPAADEAHKPAQAAPEQEASSPRPGPFARPKPAPPQTLAERQQHSEPAPQPEAPAPEPARAEPPKIRPKSATPEDFAEQIRAFVDAVQPKPSAEPASATAAPATPEPPRPGPEPIRSAASVPPRIRTPHPQPPRNPESLSEQAPRQDQFARGQEPDASESGDNLSFDFNDERGPEAGTLEEPTVPDEWSVGEEFATPRGREAQAAPGARPRLEPFGPAPGPGRPPFAEDISFVERAGMHSAGFFIALFFIVAVIFAALALTIGAAPAASASILRSIPIIGPSFETPVSLESLIGLGGIQSHYETLKDGNTALIVTGVAKNGTSVPLHVVHIGAHLLDSNQQTIANGATYCGTAISARMLAEMTPHELEFLQGVDPPKSFVLAPDGTAPFTMVFTNPPKNVSSFALTVAKAEPAAAPQPSPVAHQ